jgi:hypothetical protein
MEKETSRNQSGRGKVLSCFVLRHRVGASVVLNKALRIFRSLLTVDSLISFTPAPQEKLQERPNLIFMSFKAALLLLSFFFFFFQY